MVLPFGLALASRTFTKCMDAALFPLRQMGVCILNYLDDWLILAQSEAKVIAHRSLLLSHLERLGLRINFAKSSLSPSQRTSFLGTVFRLRPHEGYSRARSCTGYTAARGVTLSKRFKGCWASASPVLQVGQLRMRPLQYWLKPLIPPHVWFLWAFIAQCQFISVVPLGTVRLYLFPLASSDAVRVKYRKGTYSVTNVTSVTWDTGTSTASHPVPWRSTTQGHLFSLIYLNS